MTNITHPATASYPPPGRSWRVVALIVLVAIVATIDRGVLSLVVDPIRRDLGISDIQISLLQGLSFSLFYATVGLALGLGADRIMRGRLLALGLLVWSLATVAAGLSNGFWSMFASRLLVGMGEGALGPCAISLICDLFPPARRGRPLGLYLTGQAVSSGLSVLLTGAILRHSPPDLKITPLGLTGLTLVLHPWRIAFIVTGLIGLLVVPFVLAIREPRRQETAAGDRRPSIAESLGILVRRRRQLGPLVLGLAAVAAGFYATLAWGAVSITRHYGLRMTEVTGVLGPASIAAGLLGPSAAGLLVDRVMTRAGPAGRLRLLTLMPLLLAPTMLAVLMPSAPAAALLLAAMLGAYPALATVFFLVLQGSVPNELRGFAISLCGLANALIGGTGGPLLIAWLSSRVFRGPGATADALSLTLLIAMLAGIALFAFAGRRAASAAGFAAGIPLTQTALRG